MELKEGLIKDSYELIIKELQSIVTIFYLFLVGMGMLFKHQKFSEFGINVFQYADIFDFLIAPFQDYVIILFTMASLTFIYLLLSSIVIGRESVPECIIYFRLD